jgi:hypothetical protein
MSNSTAMENRFGSGERNSVSQLLKAVLSTCEITPGKTAFSAVLREKTTSVGKQSQSEMGNGTSAKSGSESHRSSAHGSVPNDPGLSHSLSDSLAKVPMDRAAKKASTTSWSSSVTSPSLPETSGSSNAETLKPTFWRGVYLPLGVGDRPRPLLLGQNVVR